MSNSDLIAEAHGFLAGSGKATLLGRLTDALESAEKELRAWRELGLDVDAETPDEMYTAMCALKYGKDIPGTGYWGEYALEALFAELGISEDDLWIEHVEPRIKRWKSAEAENVRLRAELAGLQSMQRGGG